MKKEIAGWFNCINWIPTELKYSEIYSLLGLLSTINCSFGEGLSKVHVNSRNTNPNSVLISPVIKGWTLICGYQLSKIEIAKWFIEQLSFKMQETFSFGVDIWCGYHSWMCAQNGNLVRYYEWKDGIENTMGDKIKFEAEIENYSDDSHVFYLSKRIGFDIENIQPGHLSHPAVLVTLPSVVTS